MEKPIGQRPRSLGEDFSGKRGGIRRILQGECAETGGVPAARRRQPSSRRRYCARNIHADMESAQRVSAGAGPLRAYLYGIGRKRAAEWWRRQPQRKSEAKTEFEATVPHAEAASAVADAFAKLPEEQRILLWLREVEGQSYTELAVILEIPVGTVRSRLFAAREALRGIWHSSPPNSKEGV